MTPRRTDALGELVDASEIPVITVNPGQRITIMAEIPARKVSFRYLPPGARRAVIDPGLGRPGSQLVRLDRYTVGATIDTRGMESGEGWWYFLGEDDARPDLQVAEPGRFLIRAVPRELLGLPPLAPHPRALPNGLDVLGAEALETEAPKWPWVLAGVIGGAIVAAALTRVK